MEIYDINVYDVDGNSFSLDYYKNRVMLIVNVASQCSFTSQYEALEKIYEKYEKDGLSILAFPCNQFLGQEPKEVSDIKSFCSLTYGVKFDMFAKIDVNGKNTAPLYKYLKKQASGIFGESIKWNFTKFLINREGNVIARYAPMTKPEDIVQDIEKLLL